MHARIARYTYTGDAQELAQRAEEGILPIFQSQAGFKAYTIIESEGEIISSSAWESAEAAEAANIAVASWVAENMKGDVNLIEARIGEILVATALGISTTAGITA
jgi:N-acetylglutamate synthase-like GNAT family acetyltransferase